MTKQADGTITLETTVEKAPDSAACGIRVETSDVVRWFARKSRVPVVATINGYTYRSSLSPMGGCHMLPGRGRGACRRAASRAETASR